MPFSGPLGAVYSSAGFHMAALGFWNSMPARGPPLACVVSPPGDPLLLACCQPQAAPQPPEAACSVPGQLCL